MLGEKNGVTLGQGGILGQGVVVGHDKGGHGVGSGHEKNGWTFGQGGILGHGVALGQEVVFGVEVVVGHGVEVVVGHVMIFGQGVGFGP